MTRANTRAARTRLFYMFGYSLVAAPIVLAGVGQYKAGVIVALILVPVVYGYALWPTR